MRDLKIPFRQLANNSNLFCSWWHSGIPIRDSSLDNINLYNKIIEYIMIKHPEMKKGFKIVKSNEIDNIEKQNENQNIKVYTYTNDYEPKIQIFDDLRLDVKVNWVNYYNPQYKYSLIYNLHQVNEFNYNGWSFINDIKKKSLIKHFYYIMNHVLDYAISHPFNEEFDLSKVNINYICNFVQGLGFRDESPLFTGKSRDITVKNMKTLFNSHTFTGKTNFMNGQLYQDILLHEFEKSQDEYIINNYSVCDDFIYINLIHKNNL